MSTRLPMLCPQEYVGLDMRVTTCTRCHVGWSKELGVCTVYTGAEHLPDAVELPSCPMEDKCQHQIQAIDEPCSVRQKGMICESALIWAGMTPDDAADCEWSFHASVVG